MLSKSLLQPRWYARIFSNRRGIFTSNRKRIHGKLEMILYLGVSLDRKKAISPGLEGLLSLQEFEEKNQTGTLFGGKGKIGGGIIYATTDEDVARRYATLSLLGGQKKAFIINLNLYIEKDANIEDIMRVYDSFPKPKDIDRTIPLHYANKMNVPGIGSDVSKVEVALIINKLIEEPSIIIKYDGATEISNIPKEYMDEIRSSYWNTAIEKTAWFKKLRENRIDPIRVEDLVADFLTEER